MGFPDTTVELQGDPPGKAAGDDTNKDLVATIKPRARRSTLGQF
jgi:hypothetical protein